MQGYPYTRFSALPAHRALHATTVALHAAPLHTRPQGFTHASALYLAAPLLCALFTAYNFL